MIGEDRQSRLLNYQERICLLRGETVSLGVVVCVCRDCNASGFNFQRCQ